MAENTPISVIAGGGGKRQFAGQVVVKKKLCGKSNHDFP